MLTENHPGAVFAANWVIFLPFWHCFDLKLLFPLEGESGLRLGMFTAAFLNKNTIILLLFMSCILVSSVNSLFINKE